MEQIGFLGINVLPQNYLKTLLIHNHSYEGFKYQSHLYVSFCVQ